jgi:AraC-like DNA-binding protein
MQQMAGGRDPGALFQAARGLEAGTIAICFVTAALRAVRERGLPVEPLLLSVGMSPSVLDSPQARVSVQQYGALWRLVAVTLDDEFFGQDSRRMKSGSFAMLCHGVLACPSLARALDRALRYFGLILDDLAGVLVKDAATARIELIDRAAGAHGRRGEFGREFAHETFLMLIHGLACWLVGRRIAIDVAEFAYPEPAHSAEYRRMYCADLRYDRPTTAIQFDARYLALPVTQDERSVKEFLRRAPENVLVKYKNHSSLSARVRRRLRQGSLQAATSFERLAAELHMTPATARRRLYEEGTSYQAIKDELRRDQAIAYLTHSDRSVLEVALELGFSERSAFHRAFRKWTGVSPGQFRRNQRS